jgi:hypothetical protein
MVHEKLCALGVMFFPYIRRLAKGLVKTGHEGQMGLHHTAWRWACVVHPILCLVDPLVFALCSGSFFSMKISMVFIPEFISDIFLHKKDKRRFSTKNCVSSDNFYLSVGSIPDKTSSKVIGKVNACKMHQINLPVAHLYVMRHR